MKLGSKENTDRWATPNEPNQGLFQNIPQPWGGPLNDCSEISEFATYLLLFPLTNGEYFYYAADSHDCVLYAGAGIMCPFLSQVSGRRKATSGASAETTAHHLLTDRPAIIRPLCRSEILDFELDAWLDRASGSPTLWRDWVYFAYERE